MPLRSAVVLGLLSAATLSLGCGSGVHCGTGTTEHGDVCEAAPSGGLGPSGGSGPSGPTCGAGTTLQAGQCVPVATSACSGTDVLVDGKCVAQPISCAEGTREANGKCVAEVVCGVGTVASNGACVPKDSLSCGPGTMAENGACVPTAAELACGPGTARVDDACVPVDVVWVSAPFPAGFKAPVNQGFNGSLSHFDLDLEAIDFGVPQGTQVVAARPGVVVAVRSDSNTGCGDVSCADQANYVVVDHGDATLDKYYHLQQGGVSVAVGDKVCAGQKLGSSGNTGFSTGPHLHFGVTNLWGYSLPLRFLELKASGGVAVVLDTLTSANTPAACPAAVVPSACPKDTFASRGVLLDAGVPGSLVHLGTPYQVSGTLVGQGAAVVMSRYTKTATWTTTCVQADAAKHFAQTLTWNAADFSTVSYLMFSSTDAACKTYASWKTSPRLSVVE